MIQSFNNFLHLPIIKGLFWYAWWTIIILCSPLALIFLFILFIYDVLAGIFEFRSMGHGWFNHRFLEPSHDKPILITGCGSGIGKATAIELARRGWKVYAGCRSAESIQQLKSLYIPSLIPIQLNVNNESDIISVIEIIKQHNEHGLFCLINNAGIIHNGPIDWISLESFRQVMETNYFSVVALTKACLPLIKKHSLKTGNSRIVQIGSASGLGWGIQFFAGYAASKHAVEAFSSSLRGELKPFNIHVSTLNPMIHKTGMTNVQTVTDSIHSLFESLSPRKQEEYGKDYLDYFVKNHTDYMEKNSWNVNNVIREVVHATTAKTPCIQYFQGLELLTIGGILNMIPRPINEYLMSLNGGYLYGQQKIQK
jgi:NAD(P)-dependent dehydrogenase (short-subunit alcohol dehydrogenase family)